MEEIFITKQKCRRNTLQEKVKQMQPVWQCIFITQHKSRRNSTNSCCVSSFQSFALCDLRNNWLWQVQIERHIDRRLKNGVRCVSKTEARSCEKSILTKYSVTLSVMLLVGPLLNFVIELCEAFETSPDHCHAYVTGWCCEDWCVQLLVWEGCESHGKILRWRGCWCLPGETRWSWWY